MTEPRRFTVSTIFSWALTIAVGVMTVAGVAAAFLPPTMLDQEMTRLACVIAFAAVAGLALGNANCAAAAAQHAVSESAPFWTAVFPPLLNAAIFCAASVIGVHLAWETLKAGAQPGIALPSTAAVDAAAFLIGFAKVAQAWIIETRRSLDAASIATADAAERELRSAIHAADRSASQPARKQFQPEVVEGGRSASQFGQLSHGAAGAAAVAVGVTASVAGQPTEAAMFQRPMLAPSDHSARTWADREAHAKALLEQGTSQREAARTTGVTRYKVGKIALSLAANAA